MRLIDADKLQPDRMTNRGTVAISQSQIAKAPTVKPCKDAISRNNAITSICQWGTALERSGRYTITISEMKQECADMLCELPLAILEPTVCDIEQITAEIYEHFMTIDGGVHDKSAIKCMEIIGKYKGDKE